MDTKKVFVNSVRANRESYFPDYVICKLAFVESEFKQFMADHSKNGWLNLEVKRSQNGKVYVELDTFEPKKQSDENVGSDDGSADVPF